MALDRFKPTRKQSTSDDLKSVLYVEDEDTNWEIAEFALRDKFKVTRARNAREAFDNIRLRRFNIILMDVQLSGSEFDGIEITRILKGTFDGALPDYVAGMSFPLDTPVVFVTAYQARYRREELQQAGGDDVMFKPVDFTKLSLVMSRLMVRGLQ